MYPTSNAVITSPIAHFGATYGYQFFGDSVELNANVACVSGAAHRRSWKLVLASVGVRDSGESLRNLHRIAVAPLPPLVELSESGEPFRAHAPASLPAGQGEHRLVLQLVAEGDGVAEEVHDVAVFDRPERFCLPTLVGPVQRVIAGNTLQVSVGSIHNPRAEDNLTGTLSLELWALRAPYDGGNFQGTPLAGLIIGALRGGQALSTPAYLLNYAPPPAGLWYVTLMLREWTGEGFTTRDFYNFAEPELVEPVGSATTPVASVVPTKEEPKSRDDGRVSLNSASIEQLRKIPGLKPGQVEAIVAHRPFKSLDELKKVKGIGAKTLAKIRSRLAL